jgi:uncharacterized protein (DUF1800 family)
VRKSCAAAAAGLHSRGEQDAAAGLAAMMGRIYDSEQLPHRAMRVTFFRLAQSMSVACALVLVGCTAPPAMVDRGQASAGTSDTKDAVSLGLLNRMTWGVDAVGWHDASQIGAQRYIERQLQPKDTQALPEAVQSRIAAMTITQQPSDQIVYDLEQRRKESDAIANDEDKKAAQQAYQRELTRLGNEAATRFLLRALYDRDQLQEQMTWFWMNHFNIHQYKSNLRAMIGDFEERAIRPYALGSFRDLLAATVHHPAMLRYLDNEQNATGHINENYARELMELHTLGIGGGYTQTDVQELARILTGLGVNVSGKPPNVRRDLQPQYVRAGLFEFNPNRHDYGDKQFLGQTIKGRGLVEVDEVVDRLSRRPATARFISRKLAVYFVSDDPPKALVDRMTVAFLHSEGNIAVVLRAMIDSTEFAASFGKKFKDPVHYVVSAVRLAYPDKPILNAAPMLGWLNRMGEPLYGRQTPDGYTMMSIGWTSAGQMTTRFEIAKAIGSGSAGLFKTDGPDPTERPAFPQLSNALYYQSIQPALSPPTKQALDQATSPQEWNTFLLASPEFMNR